MKIALIADTFPPLRNSGAVQLRDLSREFVAQGHQLTVILPSWEIKEDFLLEEMDGFQVLRLKSPKTKDVNYARRIGHLIEISPLCARYEKFVRQQDRPFTRLDLEELGAIHIRSKSGPTRSRAGD